MDLLTVFKIPCRTPGAFFIDSIKRIRRNSEPTTVFQRRQQLKAYQYAPLPSETHVRLLRCWDYNVEGRVIIATLDTVNLEDKPVFTALSYTWASPGVSVDKNASEDILPSCRLVILNSAFSAPLLADMKWTCNIWIGTSAGEIQLQKNLSDFLICINDENLRWTDLPPRDTSLWIDALCVDQSNEMEKASQIPLMGHIYSTAQEVLGWLGMDTSDLDNMLWMMRNVIPAFMRYFLSLSQSETMDLSDGIDALADHKPTTLVCWKDHLGFPSPPNEDCHAMWKSYFTFFKNRTWFQRAWIFQEVLLASKMRLILPGGSINREELIFFERVLEMTNWGNRLAASDGMVAAFRMQHLFEIRALIVAKQNNTALTPNGDLLAEHTLVWELDSTGKPIKRVIQTMNFSAVLLGEGPLITYLLRRSRRYGATFDVDKVNSILGIASKLLVSQEASKPYFTVTPHASAESVYTDLSRWIIDISNQLDLLSHVESPQDRKLTSLPSWVPDFSAQVSRESLGAIGFDVWHSETIDPGRRPLFAGNFLIPYATEIGQVQARFNGPAIRMSDAHGHVACLLLAVASLMKPIYPHTNESRLEALLRMMLDSPANHKNKQGAQKRFDAYYPAFLGLLAFLGPYLPLPWGNVGDEQTATVEQLQKVLPDWQAQWDLHQNAPNMSKFLVAMLHVREKSLFTTDNGHIGKGPLGAEPGDRVVIFERGFVPFVVRKLPSAQQPFLFRLLWSFSRLWSNDRRRIVFSRLTGFLWHILPERWKLACVERYTLVGECYVHGVMLGELVTPRFRRTFRPVCLV